MDVDATAIGDEVEASTDADHQVLEVDIGNDVFAVAVEELVLIDDDVSVTRLPRSPDAIDGITDMRGDVTAVIDPGELLGVEDADGRYLLVTEGRGERQKIGLMVDDVRRVREYDESDIDTEDDLGELASPGLDRDVVEGVIRREDPDGVTLVALLSLDAVIASVDEPVE